MKNLFLILLVVIMVVGGVLVGCSEPTPTAPTTTAPTTTAPTTTAPTTTAPTTTAPTTAPPTEPTPKYGGTMTMIFEAITPNIGWPAGMIGKPNASIVQGTLEFLLRADGDGNIIPWLAESYQIADDMKSITFSLRKGVKFHDGSDFNAEAVKWNLDTWIEAKAQPFWESVDIIDGYTVRVNLKEWRNTVPLSFCEGIAPVLMISKEAFDKNGLEWVQLNPVGTGPFKFVSFEPDVSYKAEKFPDYWVEGKPYLDGIDIIFVADDTTAEMMVKTAQVDFAGTSLRLAAEYEAMGLQVVTIAESIWAFVPDTANPDSPWANQKVREAAEYAIDRESIANAFYYGYVGAPNQIPPPSAQTYNPDFAYARDYDPEKAKQLLTEAGYPGGFDTTIICFPHINEDIILVVQADLKKVGINAGLEYTDFGKFSTYMGPMNSVPSNSVMYLPVPGFDSNYVSTMQFLMSRMSGSWERTPEWVASVMAAMAPSTPEVELTRVCTDIISQDALLIPLHLGAQGRVAQPNLVFTFGERGYLLFWNMEDAWLDQ